ncbi:anti-sigma factor family protein [Streptomyces longwoodensis]|uniref:anti-sigma factor family protein n=1 Tax=Streptomyces longwoodensis TaxID=68231 RepID=UPI00367F99E2
MSGTRPDPAEGHLAEQHLGDRLSALVDGELGHDARERVLAHVATCPKCKAEVDAQRRLKDVFAAVAPPAPSESFLARLQGLPAGSDPDGDGTPFGGGGIGARLPGAGSSPALGVFGVRRGEPFDLAYAPARDQGSVLGPDPGERGFGIHPVGRGETERSRGMRIAFVAAGAVSLAAIALGGMTGGSPFDTAADSRGGPGTGSNVTPARTTASGTATAPEGQRRRSPGPLFAQTGQGLLGDTPVAPTEVSAPLLPGVPAPSTPRQRFTTPVVAGAAAMSPLIRPLGVAAPVTLASWTPAPQPASSDLFAATVGPDVPSPAPSVPSAPSSSFAGSAPPGAAPPASARTAR